MEDDLRTLLLVLAAAGAGSAALNGLYFARYPHRSRARRRAAVLLASACFGTLLQSAVTAIGALPGPVLVPGLLGLAAQGTATAASCCLSGLVLRRLAAGRPAGGRP